MIDEIQHYIARNIKELDYIVNKMPHYAPFIQMDDKSKRATFDLLYNHLNSKGSVIVYIYKDTYEYYGWDYGDTKGGLNKNTIQLKTMTSKKKLYTYD